MGLYCHRTQSLNLAVLSLDLLKILSMLSVTHCWSLSFSGKAHLMWWCVLCFCKHAHKCCCETSCAAQRFIHHFMMSPLSINYVHSQTLVNRYSNLRAPDSPLLQRQGLPLTFLSGLLTRSCPCGEHAICHLRGHWFAWLHPLSCRCQPLCNSG